MIVNKYANGGGGSGSGVTPAQVQTLIDRSLVPYWDSAATESAITEAVSGISVDTTVLKGTDTTDLKNEYPGQVGDIRSWIFFDEGQGDDWDVVRAQTTEPRDYTNTDERVKITGVECNAVITKKEGEEEEAPENSFDGFEFWFNESNVYGEGPTYRCYWDSTNEEFKVEDAEGVVSGDFIIEQDPEDETLYLVLSPNRKVKYFRIYSSNWEYCIADDCYWINCQGVDYGDTDASEAIYHIVKFNDAAWFEYLGAYVSDGVSVRQNGEWVQIPNVFDVVYELQNYTYSKNDTYQKFEVNNLISAATAGSSSAITQIQAVLSASGIVVKDHETSAETITDVIAIARKLQTDENVISTALNELHDDILELSGSSVDLSAYYTSAQTENAITSKNYVTSAQVETQIVSKNYITSAETANFVTSAQVETQIDTKAAAYTPTSGFSTINGSAITNGGDITVANPDMSEYWTSAQTAYEIYTRTQDMVTSTDDYNIGWVSHIVKLTQADYDDLVNNDGVDDNTFYIIVNN